MSEAIAFDTHQFVKHLTANGFTEQQAEALANEAKMAAIKSDLLKWIFGLVLSLAGLMVGLLPLESKREHLARRTSVVSRAR